MTILFGTFFQILIYSLYRLHLSSSRNKAGHNAPPLLHQLIFGWPLCLRDNLKVYLFDGRQRPSNMSFSVYQERIFRGSASSSYENKTSGRTCKKIIDAEWCTKSLNWLQISFSFIEIESPYFFYTLHHFLSNVGAEEVGSKRLFPFYRWWRSTGSHCPLTKGEGKLTKTRTSITQKLSTLANKLALTTLALSIRWTPCCIWLDRGRYLHTCSPYCFVKMILFGMIYDALLTKQ